MKDKARSNAIEPLDFKMKFMDGSPVDSVYLTGVEKLLGDALQAENHFSLDDLEEAAGDHKPPSP